MRLFFPLSNTGIVARLVFAVCVLLIAPPSSVRADVFVLTDGTRIEGTVVREFDDLIAIKLVDGKIRTLEKSKIARRIASETPYDRYLERKAALKDDDLEGHLALAKWCAEQKLEAQSTLHFKRVLDIKPDHTEARLALGYVWVAGEWYPAGSVEAERRRREAEELKERPREIPRDFDAPKVADVAPPKELDKPVRGRGEQVFFFADEKIDRDAPKISMSRFRLNGFLSSLEPSHRLSPVAKPELVEEGMLLEVRIRCFFVKTHMFYKRIPITNVYKGEAEATLVRITNGEREVLAQIRKFEVPFSASVQIEKEKGFEYTYHETVLHLLSRMSKHPYFKRLGAEPIDVE